MSAGMYAKESSADERGSVVARLVVLMHPVCVSNPRKAFF
jgi:hypothetical protein